MPINFDLFFNDSLHTCANIDLLYIESFAWSKHWQYRNPSAGRMLVAEIKATDHMTVGKRKKFKARYKKTGVIMAVDYICGMHVDEKKVDIHVLFNENTYYFCSNECKTTFEKDPQKIVDERQNPWNSAGKGGCC